MRTNRSAGCAGALLLTLIAVGLIAWVFRDQLASRWLRTVEYTEVSPEAAASAEQKLERLRVHGETVRLSEVELSSYLRYNVAERYPDLLQNPSAALTDSTIRVGGRVPTERLPDLRELERVRDFLPDTTRVDVEGRLLPRGDGRAAIDIGEVAVAGVPIPQRYYASVLERLGRRPEPDLPANAIAFPLPEGVGSARVEGGFLILTP
jgi:hypothetical protein